MTDPTDIFPHRIPLISRNITILGERTSARLEPQMWDELHSVAVREGCSIHELSSLLYLRKQAATSFTSTLRVFLMLYNRAAATADGHAKAGHGDFHKMLARAQITPDVLRRSPSSRPSSADLQLHTLQT
jgi:predicted DNA-binding ribbon-helix-helix protein